MKVDILGLKIDNVTMTEAVDTVMSYTANRHCKTVFTPNAEIVMASIKNTSFRDILNSSDLIVPDGAGVILGARLLKTPLKEKVAGIDLVEAIFNQGTSLSVFLFGGAPGVAEKAAKRLLSIYSDITVCGTVHGYHKASYDKTVIAQINEASPDILLVALGPPLQENWICKYRQNIKTGVAIGCGGTLDVLSGTLKRAPKIMIKLNLEWLYRLIKQPRRIGRMLRIPIFLFLCIKKRLFGKN